MSLSSYIKASGKKKLYSYRRRVPSDLIGLWKNDEGKELKEVKKALHTTDKAIAMQRGASENLQFEDKAQRLRNDKHAQDRKSEIEKLEERKLVVQQVTKMLRQENLLPDQQPNISLGSTLSDIEQFSQDVDIAEEILLTNLLDEVVDEKQRQNDYDAGRWGRAGYTEPQKPIDLNSQNLIALEMLRGKVSPLSLNPSWKDALDIYLEDSSQNRSPHSRRKYEQRVKRVATELAIYLGDGDAGTGFSEKLGSGLIKFDPQPDGCQFDHRHEIS